MSRTDGFVSFLGAGIFGMKATNFEIIFPEFGFNEIGDLGESLVREIERVGTVISDVAGLIETLSGGHSSLGAKTEAAIRFNLERGSSKWYWVSFFSFGFFQILHFKISAFKLFEEEFCFFFGSESSFIEISFKNFRGIEIGNIGSLVTKLAGDFKAGFSVKTFNFLFALDD